MADPVIRIENLGKKYVIGHQTQGGYTTLRDRIADTAKSLTHQLLSGKRRPAPSHEEFWALKDISFNINQGDRVGIIGRNGAGKSTLLKILSCITEPTAGRISIRGRVASLLEVGTGFHPELTGRENIYLNGAILGMSKIEIQQKFDEIVSFAEVEQFLDTPVKHYSSGMYVRLAFAVAAHLEPEILIVDEVLAVGDIQFQRKCLGKMQDVSTQEGRTVLFVSHNMDAIQRLCSHCVLLDRGKLVTYGETAQIVTQYFSEHSFQTAPNQWVDVSQLSRMGTGEAQFLAVQYSSLNKATGFQPYADGPLEVKVLIASDADRTIGSLAVTIYSQDGVKLVNADTAVLAQSIFLKQGRNVVTLHIDPLPLNPNIYVLGVWLAYISANESHEALDYIESAFEMEVVKLSTEQVGVQETPGDGTVTCHFKIVEVT